MKPFWRCVSWLATIVVLLLGATYPASPSHAQTVSCAVDYVIQNDWGSGATVNVTIRNNASTAINGWTLAWAFPGNQQISQMWSATYTQSGQNVSASNLSWNAVIPANGGTVNFGFNLTYSGTNAVPSSFTLNGVVCGGGVAPTATNTAVAPTATATHTNTPTGPTATPTRTNTPVAPTATPTRTNTPAVPTATPTRTNTPTSGGACAVDYVIQNDWGSGATVDVTIRNNSGTAINGWTLAWTFPGNQQISQMWSATYTQSGQNVSASNLDYNATIPANGGTVNFGFNLTYSGTNAVPSSFTLNGVVCGGGVAPTATNTAVAPTATATHTNTPTGPTATATRTPTRTNTPAGPTATPTRTNTPSGPTATPTRTPTSPPSGTHLDNPFVGAHWYINPDWTANVLAQADATGGTLGEQMRLVANYSTAIWMDRIGAITEGRGLRGHLDEALAQGANLIIVVIYDLPNRDCAAYASNGELLIAEDGLNRYKTEYIDPIVNIFSDPAYRNLRIVTVIEPDSLPNLVTNLSFAACAEANSTGAYVEGIRYAIGRLRALPNVYIYLDIAHSGWLGWDSNFTPAVDLYVRLLDPSQGGPGFDSIDGFITNTANYTPVEEPFLPDPNLTIGGQPVRSAAFYEWNPYFDELDFAIALRNAFISRGLPNTIGMVIDTSRNGWGGSSYGRSRPTAVSTSTDLNTYVDESRIDRRYHRGNWCNQAAGIGARPQAAPYTGIDAFVWVKPPGESDGVSQPGIVDPTDPNKKFDIMCDPNASSRYNSAYPTGALPNAPHAGRWFAEAFTILVQNAYPPLQP